MKHYGIAMDGDDNITTKAEESDIQAEPSPQPKRGRGCLWGCLGCGGLLTLVIALCVGLFVWALSSIFDEKPYAPVTRVPDQKALSTAMVKLQGVSQGLTAAPSSDNGLSSIQLTTKEANALLSFAVNMSRGKKIDTAAGEVRIADAQLEHGVLSAKISIDTGSSLGFGNWLNIQAKLVPEIKNKHVTLAVKKLVLGSLEVPPGSMKATLDSEIVDFETSQDGQDLLNIMKKLVVGEQGVSITFDPQALMTYLMQALANQNTGG